MAYDLHLADRIRKDLNDHSVKYKEKEMFGSIVKNDLMAHIDHESFDGAIKKKGACPMDGSSKRHIQFNGMQPELQVVCTLQNFLL